MDKSEICAGILPFRIVEGRWEILVICHVQGNYWACPKGRLRENEPFKEGACRELYEETNLKVSSFLKLPSLEENYTFTRGGHSITKHVVYYPALVEGTLHIGDPEEVSEAQWMPLEQGVLKITFKQTQELIQKFIKKLPK